MSKDNATVLIVDDMGSNLSILSGILKDEYKIKVAKSGQKAIEIAKQGGIDLILLDVVMPGMDGYEAMEILQQTPSTGQIPVIFVTGNASAEDEEKGFLLGAVDYIVKPFKPTTVKSRVANHINLHQKQQQLQELYDAIAKKNDKLKRYTDLIDKNVITSSTDLDGVITSVSTAFCEISGYSPQELIGSKHNIVWHPDMPQSLYAKLWDTITSNKTWSGEIKNRKKNGQYYWVKASISPIFENNKKIGYTAIRQDITDKKRIEEISITDGLTGIYNRRHFNDVFEKAIQAAKRKDELVCFLLMDIDHFKQYNDTYGHQKGDEALKSFAQCLVEQTKRGDDMAFRLGGEEFGIVFKASSEQKALDYAQNIRKSIQDLGIEHKHNSAASVLTASMGLV
ncbi:MAG: diguanylate cyclase, partial [Campylobacterota bacterium]